MNSDNQKKRIKLPLHAYLLYLLVASLLFTGVSFSSYVATTSGADSARVAKFEIETNPTSNITNVTLNSQTPTTITYTFNVKNNSEVAVKYEIIVTTSIALPSYMSFTLNGINPTSVTGNTYKWKIEGVYAPNSMPQSYSLVLTNTFVGAYEDTSFSNNLVSISVSAEQID